MQKVGSKTDIAPVSLRVIPANQAPWKDLELVLSASSPRRCQCQRYKLQPRESFASFPDEERSQRLRQQTHCEDPVTGETTGIIAYLDDDPVGWCAVQPRTAYQGLLRNSRVPWVDRADDKTDDSVWAITCFVTRIGYRRRGISRALASAAARYAQERGARAVEGYPLTTTAVLDEELHVGTVATFSQAGFQVISHPTKRRVVMRKDF
ncbi:GNAT family N-acetyltransferase [Arthrobacter sp. ZGTC412]|uniref:GNAT family N-acetyltransferase n=1 Tax=Arthrobacter sp. ZGTC412 TaxID=2058900 RepID=UPI000CE52B98|nr:GNAT family N-acetyltransferase [Arthrobacter sp. ZGTC412]